MRSAFNTTCTIHKGPGAFAPGSVVGTFTCRYVIEDAIRPSEPGVPSVIAYLTIQDYMPRGIFDAPFFRVDTDIADRVTVATHPGVEFFVFYTDAIDWYTQAPYFRAYLVPLPVPPLGPEGGIMWGGDALVIYVRVLEGDGGILWGGDATVDVFTVFVGDGGILWGGDATVSFTPGLTDYIYDTFTDSNGTPLTSHTPEVGGPWLTMLGTMSTVSNRAEGTAFSSLQADARIDTHHTSYTLTAKLSYASAGGNDIAGILFRTIDTGNTWYAYIYSSTFFLQAFVGNAVVSGGSLVGAIAANTEYLLTIGVTPSGVNAVLTGPGVSLNLTNTNTSLNTETHVGVYVYSASGANAGSYVDDLHVVP